MLNDDNRVLDMTTLVELGRTCTQMEKNSEEAERHLREFLVLQYLESEFVGEELPGVITGFSSAGLWIALDRYLAEGLVTWEDMGGKGNRPERWVPIEGTGQLVSSRTGSVLCIGDPVTVLLMRVDPAERDMELMLKERPSRNAREMPQPRSKKKNKRGGRGKSGKRRRR